MERKIKKEKAPEGNHVNLGYAWTLRGQFGPTELARVGEDAEA